MIEGFKGLHAEGKSHNDVKLVLFRKSNLNYFPRDLGKHFPNLTDLFIIGSGLKEVTKNDLKGLEGLTCLHIRNCQLTTLPDDLFTEMPNLREVSFCGNKIDFASSELLKPLIGREIIRLGDLENWKISLK